MLPEVGSRIPAMHRAIVVLPLPLSPISPSVAPSSILNVTSLRMFRAVLLNGVPELTEKFSLSTSSRGTGRFFPHRPLEAPARRSCNRVEPSDIAERTCTLRLENSLLIAFPMLKVSGQVKLMPAEYSREASTNMDEAGS